MAPSTTKPCVLLGTASSACCTGVLGMGKTTQKPQLGENPPLPLDIYGRGMSRRRGRELLYSGDNLDVMRKHVES